MKISINKKILAREILTAIAVILISSIAYFILNTISQNLIEKEKKISEKIESSFQTKYQGVINESLIRVWESFSNNSLFDGTYEDFLNEYGSYGYSDILWKMARNNGLYTKSLDEFQYKYFTSERAIRDIYNIDKAKNSYSSYHSFSTFRDKIYSDKGWQLYSYELILETGYKGSFEDFLKLIQNDVRQKASSEILYEKSILIDEQQKLKNNIFYNADIVAIVTALIIAFYLLRLLLFIIIWSIKQLKQ